ncbi:MAG: hypothetical protein MUE69_10460 [Myxococcota bacterium]|jgi:hypothetical protein|nr:hypothetical protein [Myxococcota bacterium]
MRAIERALTPLDVLRRHGLRALGRVGRRLIRDRELRVGVGAALAVGFAFVGATTFPIVLLALGPVLLGVPHVLADLRYLVVRRGLHRRALGLLALAGLVPAALLGNVWPALASAAAVALCSRASIARRLAIAMLFGALACLAAHRRFEADLAFAHLHNLVAVLLWWLWRPRVTRWHLGALTLYVAASLAIVAMPTAWWLGHDVRFVGFDLHDARASLAPCWSETLAVRMVVLFAFAQSIHYAVWLRLVPDDDRERATPRTFRASFRALRDDLGRVVLAVGALAAMGVLAWALVDLGEARTGYLRAAIFHGHLELVALALVATEGRPRGA